MVKLYSKIIAIAAFGSLSLTASANMADAQTGKWTCSADKLKTGSYKGGKTAKIHLQPYSSGGTYPVSVVSETEVTGVTKDGTVFTCVRS